MKRKALVALSLALLMVLSGLSGSLAYADQGPVSGSEVGTEEVHKTVENDQVLLSEPGEEEAEKKDLEISPETVAQPVRAGEKTFTDLAKDHWAYSLVSRAATAGWINGYPDGSFKPENKITRAEVVTMTNRMLNRKADEAFIKHNQEELTHFKDVTTSNWAYHPIMEATHGHEYTRDKNQVDEVWRTLTSGSFIYDK